MKEEEQYGSAYRNFSINILWYDWKKVVLAGLISSSNLLERLYAKMNALSVGKKLCRNFEIPDRLNQEICCTAAYVILESNSQD